MTFPTYKYILWLVGYHDGKIVGQVEERVCELHAQGVSSTQISRVLAQENIKILPSSVWKWINKAKSAPKLQQAIDKYRSNPLAVAIAHKRVRLEDLNRERVDLITTLQRYKAADGAILPKKFFTYLSGLKRLIEMEREAREEIERRPDMVAYFQRTGPYAEASNEELRKIETEVREQLLIISRQVPLDKRVDFSPEDPEGTDKG